MGKMAHYPAAALSGGGETCAVPAASQQLLRLKDLDEVTPRLEGPMELVGYVAGPRFAWPGEIKGLAEAVLGQNLQRSTGTPAWSDILDRFGNKDKLLFSWDGGL